ncbi:MAG TPA: hypothetical protein VI386_39185 [Candidatus Sulfotelmatobacter sp.]
MPDQTHVVAHIPFTGLSMIDMAIQKRANDKYYLYVQHTREEGISIIDVSKPSQPKAIGVISSPDTAGSSRMNLTGDLAFIAESGSPIRDGSSKSDLVLWDLANPASPRVVQRFTGVVTWLQDERNFVYVLNREGLWVLSTPVDSQPEQSESTDSYLR